jgi:hypothetical protein
MQYVTADGLPPVSKIGLGTMRPRAWHHPLSDGPLRRPPSQ